MGKLTKKELWYWLCNINGIGYKKIKDLLVYYGNPLDVFVAKEEDLLKIPSLTDSDRRYLSATHDEEHVKREYDKLIQQDVRFILRGEEEYPSRLEATYDPPHGIYIKGKLPREHIRTIGMVGARNCTTYGREVALYFARELANKGIQVISGLALGIDGYSHEGALLGEGYTLGILGSGIDVCYPKYNQYLYDSLTVTGGIMSEYGLGVHPKPGNFPRRNRLIAGMSDGILVVEASKRSGSFITVDQGLEQGKDIFVIPGRITDDLSVGCNQLVKMGAELVCHPNEIFAYYQMEERKGNLEVVGSHANISFTELEERIMKLMSLDPIHVSSLLEKTNLEIGKLMQLLLQLEQKNCIRQVAKNYYINQIE